MVVSNKALVDKIEALELRQETHEKATKRELEAVNREVSTLKNALVEKFQETNAHFKDITDKQAKDLAKFQDLSSIKHSLEVSLRGLLQQRITAFKSEKFEWDKNFLDNQTPAEFYNDNEVNWQAVTKTLQCFKPKDFETADLQEKVMLLKEGLSKVWEKYVPTERDLQNLVDREAAFAEQQEQFESDGEILARIVSGPFDVINTGGRSIYFAGTTLLALGATTVVTGGVAGVAAIVLLPAAYVGYQHERHDKWKKLQMNIIGHVLFLNQIKDGVDPTTSLKEYTKFNREVSNLLRQQKYDKYIDVVESNVTRLRGFRDVAKKGIKEGAKEVAAKAKDSVCLRIAIKEAFGPSGGGVAIKGFTEFMAQGLCNGVVEMKKPKNV